MLVDNKSVYLPQLVRYLKSRKVTIVKVDSLKFDLKKLKHEKIDGVILSGGSNRFLAKKRDFNFGVIRLFKKKPILGICLGHELIVEFYRGVMYMMNRKAKGYSYIYVTKDNKLAKKGRLYVFKSHNYATGILSDCFEQLAWSSDCENEMIEHKKRPLFGVQFHPEMNSKGQIILDNFLKLTQN